jgi:hypothetical protein
MARNVVDFPGKGKPQEAAPDGTPLKLKLRLELESAQADLLEVKNQIIKKELVDKEIIASVFARLFGVWTQRVHPAGFALSPLVCAALKIPEAENDGAIHSLIDGETYAATERIRDAMIAWIGERPDASGGTR